MARKIVSVIGSSVGSDAECIWAERLGEILAEAGCAVICGGGSGVMQAVCRGAAGRGGHTIGVLPGENPEEANQWVTTSIATGMGTSRNRIIALSGSAAVAVGGSYGTLSEIAFALQAGRPVCGWGSWKEIPGVTAVSTPEEALAFVLEKTGGTDAQR